MDKNIEGVLSSVMGNDDLMSKIKEIVKSNNGDATSSLSEVISAIAPEVQKSENSNTSKGIFTESETKSNEQQNDSLNSFISSFSHTISKNAPLLIALKPYLSKERCQIIESIVKISQIADVLKLI